MLGNEEISDLTGTYFTSTEKPRGKKGQGYLNPNPTAVGPPKKGATWSPHSCLSFKAQSPMVVTPHLSSLSCVRKETKELIVNVGKSDEKPRGCATHGEEAEPFHTYKYLATVVDSQLQVTSTQNPWLKKESTCYFGVSDRSFSTSTVIDRLIQARLGK